MSNKLVIAIAGLHCPACELLSENSLGKIENVTQVKVNHKTGIAEIFYKDEAPSLTEIKNNLEELGYKLNNPTELDAHPTPTSGNYSWLWLVLVILLIYWFISRFNFFDFSSLLGQKDFSFSLALLVGLVAGVSTCLALVGGLILGAAANYAKNHPEATRFQKFQPHLLFNAGRIGGFFLLGGILGLIGSGFRLSPFINGVLTLFVGLVIMFLGLKLLNIFPGLNNFDISLPKSLGRRLKTNNTLLLGALSFFLPCGFTQAMQIYALGTGNFLSGGLVMALFALGTAPGLLGIGGLASLLKNNGTKTFFKIAGGIIVIFALININNGFKLIQISSGNNYTNLKTRTEATDSNSPADKYEKGDIQIINMTETSRGYVPNKFTIIKDKPVRFIIDAQAPYSCASALIIPALNIERQLKKGENIIEFTPTKIGTIPFSCSMGMYTGSFTVIAE